jgi:uncharacterized membrane protein YhaH (DUF805 family)
VLDYMFMPFRRYADFRGRSRRKEFWSFALFNLIVLVVIGMIVAATTGTLSTFSDVQSGGFSAMASLLFGGAGLLLLLYWLVTIVPSVAVTVRRLHDRDMSGWWYLGFIVLSMIPLVGFLVSIAFLVVTCLPGTPGANRFGPDPKDPLGAQVFA